MKKVAAVFLDLMSGTLKFIHNSAYSQAAPPSRDQRFAITSDATGLDKA
jgi:hypothetical protein